MTAFERAAQRAKDRTAAGVPTIVTTDRGVPHLRQVPSASSWPRGKGGNLIGREKRDVYERHPRKLTEALAFEIRATYKRGVHSLREVAEWYGVSIMCVQMIVTGKRWPVLA